jgi:hypothetical protein
MYVHVCMYIQIYIYIYIYIYMYLGHICNLIFWTNDELCNVSMQKYKFKKRQSKFQVCSCQVSLYHFIHTNETDKPITDSLI